MFSQSFSNVHEIFFLLIKMQGGHICECGTPVSEKGYFIQELLIDVENIYFNQFI